MGAHGGAPLLNRLACRGSPPCLPFSIEAQALNRLACRGSPPCLPFSIEAQAQVGKLSCSKPPVVASGIRPSIGKFHSLPPENPLNCRNWKRVNPYICPICVEIAQILGFLGQNPLTKSTRCAII